MAWIKVENHTPDKPEIGQIAEMLNLDPEIVFTKCFRLWAWSDELTKTGFVKGATRAQIDRMVGVLGFSKALEQVEWLSVTPTGITIPKYSRHNSQSAKSRALTAVRVARHRKKKCNAKNVTRGEERRGEKRRRDKTKGDTPLNPLTWSRESGWTNTDSYRGAWTAAFPKLDIDRELAKAHSWLLANPKKTYSDWARFFHNWLGRSKPDDAPSVNGGDTFTPADPDDPRLLFASGGSR